MLRVSGYILLFIAAVFCLKRVALFSLRNNSADGELVYPREMLQPTAFNVPPFVMELYQTYANDYGTVERNSKRTPAATVHCFIAQGNVVLLT